MRKLLVTLMVLVMAMAPAAVFADSCGHDNWEYSAEGNMIKRVCQTEGCGKEDTATLLEYSHAVQDGMAAQNAIVQYSGDWTETERDNFDISYFKGDEKLHSGAPCEVGQYRVDLSYGGVTASMTYGIHEAIVPFEPNKDECMRPHFVCTCCNKHFALGDPTLEYYTYVELPADEFLLGEEHEMGEWEVVKESTCDEEGQMVRGCSKCGYEETGTLGMKGHAVTPDNDKCKVCGQDPTPETGDTSSMAGWFALMILAAAVACGAGRRKGFVK